MGVEHKQRVGDRQGEISNLVTLASHRDASVGVREYWSVGLQRLTQVA